MNLRAFIFDVYGTLLDVGPARSDAEVRWQTLCRDLFNAPARYSRLEFSVASNKVIAQRHAAAHALGIAWPEVCWPAVVSAVLPELDSLSESERQEFIYQHIKTGHTTHLAQGAADVLRFLQQRGWLLGIASNAQAYTIRELGEGLAEQGLSFEIFEPALCFWSCEHGFSKPNPHVFQILSARLGARGVSNCETMMIGDRLDNDIEPALRHGWQAWQLPSPGQAGNGGWSHLLASLMTRQRTVAR